MDLFLASFDVLGSFARTKMLNSIGLLTDDDLAAIQQELNNMYNEIATGKFII